MADLENKSAVKNQVICIIGILLMIFLSSCSSQAPTETIQATIKIVKIVDKDTQRPIQSNIVTFRWETQDGAVLKTETYKNQTQLSTTMPADGSVRLFVTVISPGYERWENGIRMHLNQARPLEINVEMERRKGLQGI